jgi:hypothetical protein
MLETIINFQNAKFENLSYFSRVFGRCETITVDNKFAPYHYIGNGEYIPVSDFDLYGGSIYWRKNGQVSISDISSTSLIGSRKLVEVNMPMRIIVVVPKGKLSDDDAYASERIANTLIRTIQENNSTLKQAIEARKLTFNITGWEDNAQEIKKQEYSGRDILPQWVYLSMDINVVIEADASCLSTECEYYVTPCEILTKLTTAETRRDCILPEFDFSTDADFNALSNTQEADLTNRLCGGGSDVTITVNSAAWSTETCGDTENIPVKNTAGTNLGSKVGANWEIADINLTDTDASVLPKVAGINLACTLIPALSCAQLNHQTSGLTITQRQLVQTVENIKTGQTTSYRTGDDGDNEYGRLSDFYTLSCNNPFGNTNRFTDELGGQTYTNDLVVDWATRGMWYRVSAIGQWNTAIDGAVASTQGGFTDWVIPNVQDIMTICNYSLAIMTNFVPINLDLTGTSVWTSTTQPSATVNAMQAQANNSIVGLGKSNSRLYIFYRKFTMADLGL